MIVQEQRTARHWDLAYRHGTVFEQVTDAEQQMFATFVRTIREAQDMRVGCRAVDIGCGTGEWTRALAAMGIDVRGFDFSAVALSKARKLSLGARSDRQPSYELWDVNTDPIPTSLVPGTIDIVTCRLSLSYLDVARFLTDVRRWLAPEGVLHVVTKVAEKQPEPPEMGPYVLPHRGLDERQLKALCQGWRSVDGYKLDPQGETTALVLQHPVDASFP
ncbi:class I SAM-dependent methyltransferase [Streptomyces sp. NPDC001691]|uniref:class I SAM-dependent methyltransferase n=1 Tax=Streptomyces sp. NPDC001691 TaxID=3364600 RepID=UPI00369D1DFF